MHLSQSTLLYQQKRISHHAANSDSYTFFNLLTGPGFLEQVDSLLPEHRERLFPPTETLSMFLAQAMNEDSSCQKVVNDAAIKRLQGGLPRCSTNTGSYCQARQRLPAEMIKSLTRYTGTVMAANTPDAWHWRGRPVRLVDGATVSMPDTQENQTVYPQPSGQKPGLGFPICRIVGIICLGSGALLNAAIGPCKGKGGDEQSLLRNMLDTLNPGDIILGDAFYATYFLLCALQKKGVDAVFEQHGSRKRSTDFRRGKRLGKQDHLITLKKPKCKPDWMSHEAYDQAPDSLLVRELHAGGKTLLTTLLDSKTVSKANLKAFYQDRWHIEVDLRHIKTTLGMEILSCRTPEMVEKEIWAYLLAYNLIRVLMAQAALLSDILPRQLSFKHALQLWIAWLPAAREGYDDNQLAEMFLMIAQRKVGKRPGRIEPRAVKRRPKPFPLLTKIRAAARENVRKNGHPKKAK
jgi:hypothetical protein